MNESGIIDSVGLREDAPFGQQSDEPSFEENVLAEERVRQRTLHSIRFQSRQRQDSVSSGEGDALRSLSAHGACAAGSVDGGALAVSTDRQDPNGVRAEVDVRQQLFEEPEAYPHTVDFQRVIITDTDEPQDEDIQSCEVLAKCMKLREKYISMHPIPPQDIVPNHELCSVLSTPLSPVRPSKPGKAHFRRRLDPEYDVFSRPVPCAMPDISYSMEDGVFNVYRTVTQPPIPPEFDLNSSVPPDATVTEGAVTKEKLFQYVGFKEFVADFDYLRRMISAGPVKSYSFKRLKLLEARFKLHILLNDTRELEATKSVPHRDFYNVRKVDTHVHHSACMNAKHLLRFIKNKLRNNPQEIVVFRDGQFLTLGEVFKSLGLTAYDLSIDTLDMHANNTFHRFDRFNLKYNPAGQSRLREIFLKTDNVIGGRYLAEITKEVMSDLEASKYQMVEWRVSIYGRKASEWEGLARWFYVNKLAHKNVRWLIQVPRLFHLYRKNNEVKSFAEFLNNIFAPLFEVTLNPQSNLPLHYFLETIVGFDSVDDESRPEFGFLASSGGMPLPTPENWTQPENPPYGYWMYYMYANILVLNKMRAERGLTNFQFRPHCGEAGDPDHLISTYLVADQINHGILLNKLPALHYLYYLSQVGIAMSPLSNNKLFMDYNKNPFPKYFSEGMNVSLSTDDPLMLHYTKDALVEEYSVATQVWKLSGTDQCEIARNSVLQSGWEKSFKLHWLGADCADIRETNVPEIRVRYRRETLAAEIAMINRINTV